MTKLDSENVKGSFTNANEVRNEQFEILERKKEQNSIVLNQRDKLIHWTRPVVSYRLLIWTEGSHQISKSLRQLLYQAQLDFRNWFRLLPNRPPHLTQNFHLHASLVPLHHF